MARTETGQALQIPKTEAESLAPATAMAAAVAVVVVEVVAAAAAAEDHRAHRLTAELLAQTTAVAAEEEATESPVL